ncbi:hypothetical protein BB561_000480 [Smittium simulii]|uniref:Uncharacterized protein n=1 Tax=Smittium simulii TaxID=133385 RepID=A0A2T9YYX7_9FUNG|nr:hypothetical protein BB561_000480 [Smittium simulii]
MFILIILQAFLPKLSHVCEITISYIFTIPGGYAGDSPPDFCINMIAYTKSNS